MLEATHYKRTLVNGILYDFIFPVTKTEATINDVRIGIEKDISSNGLSLKKANENHIGNLLTFQKNIFSADTILETDYELYRIIKYGTAFLLEDKENNILGSYTSIHYETNGHKEGYGVRVGISPEISGNNYAASLAKYSMIFAYENGCKTFAAMMNPQNYKSASNVLNHVGYHCEHFHSAVPSMGPRFDIKMPLSEKSLIESKVDQNKVQNFIANFEPNIHYALLDTDDLNAIDTIYKSTNFKIISYLRKSAKNSKDRYFAINPCAI